MHLAGTFILATLIYIKPVICKFLRLINDQNNLFSENPVFHMVVNV